MSTFPFRWLQNQWKDPVWSKVIAAAIIAVVGAPIYGLYQSLVQDVNFWEAFCKFWTLSIPLWAMALVILSVLLWFLTSRKSNFSKNDSQESIGATKLLYEGKNPSIYDFETDPERDWDDINKKRVGERAKGEFKISSDNIIEINRTNHEGQFQLRLVKYIINGNPSHLIPKDLIKEGKRRLRVTGQIKHSGGGSQTIIFVMRNENELTWLDSRTEIVNSENWQLVNFVLHGSYSKDVILRIDSRDVVNPPNSIFIRDLMVWEYV